MTAISTRVVLRLDGMEMDSLLHACNDLGKAQEIFANAVRHLRRIKSTTTRRDKSTAARRVAPNEKRYWGGAVEKYWR